MHECQVFLSQNGYSWGSMQGVVPTPTVRSLDHGHLSSRWSGMCWLCDSRKQQVLVTRPGCVQSGLPRGTWSAGPGLCPQAGVTCRWLCNGKVNWKATADLCSSVHKSHNVG